MERVRVAFLGLGLRGPGLLEVTTFFDYVDITAVCDVFEDRVEKMQDKLVELGREKPFGTTDYHEVLKRDDVDMVIISAAWEAHIPMAIDSMRAKKITAMEVGGAYSVDDCWELVKTYEETKTPFVFMENCCYGEDELLVTNMVRKGVLGEVVYCHGAYGHDLRDEICGGLTSKHYRLRNYIARNCDNYPTHQFGPIAKILNINRGNRILSICTMASKSRGLAEYIKGKEEFEPLKDTAFSQGDIVHSLIKCADGSLITLKLDTTLPRAYSREFTISGTKGMFSFNGNLCFVDGDDYNHNLDVNQYMNSANKYRELYQSKLWKSTTQEDRDKGHGGMDYLMLRDIYQRVLDGREMPMDVYDAATWMVITVLSENSISKGGAPVEVPDFTHGKWVMRESQDVAEL